MLEICPADCLKHAMILHLPGIQFNYLNVSVSMLPPRILRRISYACRLIISDLVYRYSDVLEYFKKSLSMMSERNRAVMRISALDQYMAVESAHLRYREYADAAEGTCRNRKDLAVSDISPKLIIRRTLQTEERNITRNQIPFQRSLRNLFR